MVILLSVKVMILVVRKPRSRQKLLETPWYAPIMVTPENLFYT